MNVPTQESIKIIFLAVLPTNLFVLMINSVNQLLFLEVKMLAFGFTKAIFKEYQYCKKVMKTILTKI